MLKLVPNKPVTPEQVLKHAFGMGGQRYTTTVSTAYKEEKALDKAKDKGWVTKTHVAADTHDWIITEAGLKELGR